MEETPAGGMKNLLALSLKDDIIYAMTIKAESENPTLMPGQARNSINREDTKAHQMRSAEPGMQTGQKFPVFS